MKRMIEYRSVPDPEFKTRIPEMAGAFVRTLEATPPFKGSRFHEEATRQGLLTELEEQQGFGVMAAEQEGKLAGFTTFQELDLDSLAQDLLLPGADTLTAYLQAQNTDGIEKVAWISRTIVVPEFQRRGVATQLRHQVLSHFSSTYPQGAFVLTSHHLNNDHIIQSSKKLGFQPTGIQQIYDGTPEAQYWYRTIDARYGQNYE